MTRLHGETLGMHNRLDLFDRLYERLRNRLNFFPDANLNRNLNRADEFLRLRLTQNAF